MRSVQQLVLGLAFALALAVASPSCAETLTNQSVVEMTKVGLGADIIVAKIRASVTNFDVSTDQLVALKQQGVADAVIAAMVNASSKGAVSANAVGDSNSADPSVPHASGIYLLEQDRAPAKMEHLDPTASNQTQTSGMLASAFTYGLAPVQIKTVLPNPEARIRTNSTRPVFYFYFDQANSSLSGNAFAGPWLPGAVTSPNEFSLVRFEISGGRRMAVLGQMNITGMKTGVMDKARVAFTYSDVAPGVFKVTPSSDLAPGEYGFVYSVTGQGGGFGGAAGAKIFDFGVVKLGS